MNRIRLCALLLALCLCVTLLPAGAFAEGEYGGLIRLRFTAQGGAAALVTLVDAAGNPLLPLSEEGVYLLAPGMYSYYAIDAADGSVRVPVTALTLDGSEGDLVISLDGAAAAPAVTETPAAQPPEESAAMPVTFRCDRAIDFAGLTVTSDYGAVMQPWMDPLTGQVQFQNYLLPPGQYSYWYHDPAGLLPDGQGSFSVTDGGMQTVALDLSGETAEGCYSATAVNPYYAGIITEDYIPHPSVSPQQSLAQLVAELSPDYGMSTVFYEGPDGTSARANTPVMFDTPEAAGAALKRALLQRQTEIAIRVKTHIKPTESIWWDMCWMIYNEAIRHTGAPTEGDYLRYEYGGVNCNGSAVGSDETSTYYYEFIYSPLYFTTLAQESELDSRVSEILNSLQLSGKTEEQKIRAIYEYLCGHVRYEQARDTLGFTAYKALVNGSAACQGFSVAFYRLCLELGIDARVVTSKDMGHAWNIVRADGRNYYAADATWDAGRGAGEWKYYLRGRNNWQTEHSLGDEFADGRFADYSFPEADYSAPAGAVIHSVSLMFDGLIRIKYYFKLPESLIAEQGSSIVFSRSGTEVLSVPLSEGGREGEYTTFYCSVNAEELDTPIQARIRRADGSFETISSGGGTTYPNGFFFSPMEYARQMKTSASTAAMRALAQALEDYGTAAQNYFKNGTATLRDEVLAVSAADLDAWTIRAEGLKPEGFQNASVSVMFEADNSLRLYLQFTADADLSRCSFEIDGKSAALRRKSDGSSYLTVENIGANALDAAHSFTISDGTAAYTFTVSVLGYAKTAIERGTTAMANLARALYLYNRAAENYFG